ncbi:transposase (ISSod13) [Legionella birminghamensis]|uniref:Transposase (ISSod13) n=1 Tax=Legionella birminghamensis TaxID=28083 RepID=A0A378I7Q9_9GAMM|nr:transposase (ISSod13) [Legionella birminghamensis]STX31073.1 transposase (ISSod13) [Legionella birminghamensis]
MDNNAPVMNCVKKVFLYLPVAFVVYGFDTMRILTDRGTEYCGKVEQHDYQLYLAINNIDHTKTKVQSPQTNDICERFNKTILQEFFKSLSVRNSTIILMNCKKIWMDGSIITMMSEPIRAKCAADEHQCKL